MRRALFLGDAREKDFNFCSCRFSVLNGGPCR
ncbi:SWIM zinc finger family protein [Bradyrhizobium sp.]